MKRGWHHFRGQDPGTDPGTTDTCRRLRDLLAERGPVALRSDESAQLHLEDCEACFRELEAFATLDAGFEAMPRLDAPDELVESLLQRQEIQPATSTSSRARSGSRPRRWLFWPGRPRLRAAMAMAMLALVSLSIFVHQQMERAVEPLRVTEVHDILPVPESVAGVSLSPGVAPASVDLDAAGARRSLLEQQFQGLREQRALGYVGAELPPQAAVPDLGGGKTLRKLDSYSTAGADKGPQWVGTEADITFRGGSARIESDASGPFDNDDDQRERVRERLRERLKNLPRGLQRPSKDKQKTAPQAAQPKNIEALKQQATTADVAREQARRFLATRESLDVASQPATGYWTNSYVPGDPMLRFLQARLVDRESTLFRWSLRDSEDGSPLRLHNGALRPASPFDSPPEAALALELTSDPAAIEGESRLLVQVGLVGTTHRGGRRPAMNVALVLDLRGEIDPETGARLVALAGALTEAQELGDRFRLIAAGRGSGVVQAPDRVASETLVSHLRRGQATVAVRRLLAPDQLAAARANSEASLDLVAALRQAIEDVTREDDPASPLGSSAILLATSQPLGAEAEALFELAHLSALAGISVSVISLGNGVDLEELNRLALAGQGTRRLLQEPKGARRLVDLELAAAGRAVARAVRLQIELAPGVRLIDVVGARRLSAAGAERVRESERAIDRRLARNLGIEADRGDDEAGLQIVIPTFDAGDHHTVLLDVIATGPGPIAEVSVRYKDLVQLENAVVRGRLDLPPSERDDGPLEHGPLERGPLERHVLKNLLAHQLRDVLDDAGQRLAAGDPGAAAEQLSQHRSLLSGLQSEVAGFHRDTDIRRDLEMLDEYLQLMDGRRLPSREHRAYVADSLRYAARLKVLPPPSPVDGAG